MVDFERIHNVQTNSLRDFICWGRTLLLFTKALKQRQIFPMIPVLFTGAQQENSHIVKLLRAPLYELFVRNRQMCVCVRIFCCFSIISVCHIENFSCYQLMFAFSADWLNQHHQLAGFILKKKQQNNLRSESLTTPKY